MKSKFILLFLVSLIATSCSKDDEGESAINRFANSTWAFYIENSTRAYYKYDFTSTTAGKYWYYKGTDNTNKFDFTYTADNEKLKINYKINSVSTELDENGNLVVVSEDATIIFFIEQSGDNTISGYYQYSLKDGANRYPYNAVKLK
ncbi:MAG: hypothetical protein J6X07_10205 [Prevotella sp.]|nr:hypothetical protein [Prevotella sp.]